MSIAQKGIKSQLFFISHRDLPFQIVEQHKVTKNKDAPTTIAVFARNRTARGAIISPSGHLSILSGLSFFFLSFPSGRKAPVEGF